MKEVSHKIFSFFISLILFLFSFSIYAAENSSEKNSSEKYIPEKYIIDSSHSYVTWHISHFGFSHPSGKWLANGTLMLDKEKPENSKVDVTIQMTNVVTGIPKLDEHLTGKDFFDVKKFPVATFVSQKVEVTEKDKARVYGTLTLHGVSKPVVLKVKLNKLAVSPITHKDTAGFTAITTLKRSDFGIDAYSPGLGDKVKIRIELEANKS